MSFTIKVNGHDNEANWVDGETEDQRRERQRLADEHVVEEGRKLTTRLRGVGYATTSTSSFGETDLLDPRTAQEQQDARLAAFRQGEADRAKREAEMELDDELYNLAEEAEQDLPENWEQWSYENKVLVRDFLKALIDGGAVQRPEILGKEETVTDETKEPKADEEPKTEPQGDGDPAKTDDAEPKAQDS